MKKPSIEQAFSIKRRQVLNLGVGTAAAAVASAFIPRIGSTEDYSLRPSPALQPFLDPLPIPPVKTPTTLFPAPGKFPVTGEAGRLPHQAWERFPPQVFYRVDVKPGLHKFHAHLPQDTIWGYDGIFPGPTFAMQIGTPSIVRFYNQLPKGHVGFGSPEIITHLHGGHTPPESDGFPIDYYSTEIAGLTLDRPGHFYDHHYPFYPAKGNINLASHTYWYHDHREDHTADNVYKGLAGFMVAFDEFDTGDERTGLRLPAGLGKYDIPLLLQDKRFDASGYLSFDQFGPEGFLGDRFLVNGKVQPYLNVEARKYRFRMLNGSMARYHEMYLTDDRDKNQEFTFIASDGNLLPQPITLKRILLGMAERADIIIDFSKYAPGTVLYLVNRLFQETPRKPTKDRLYPGIRMLQFRVGNPPAIPDKSVIPDKLKELPAVHYSDNTPRRRFRFERENGQWAINDKFFDETRVDARPRQGVPEIWVLENNSGGWAHPIHIHLDDFRILTINGKAPPRAWAARKDVVTLLPNDKAEVLVQFNDYHGKYVMHCHQTAHEDHAMMLRYDVER